MNMLYPASMMNPRKVDEHFEQEAQEFSNVALFDEMNDVLRNVVEGETYLYRGWILTVEQYTHISEKIARKGATMAVSVEQYAHDQFAENYINDFGNMTPNTVVLSYSASDDEILEAAHSLSSNAFYVKGSSKSAKHNSQASIASSIDEVVSTVHEFRKEIPEDQEKWILLREFVDFTGVEYRTWWSYGKLLNVQLHPQSEVGPEFSYDSFVDELSNVTQLADSPLAVVDISVDESGRVWVVEMGSGMVSQSSVPFDKVLANSVV